jgi:hypothetical protein
VCSALSWLGWLVTAEARVRFQASKCQISGGQKCHWDSFFFPRVLLFFFTVIIIPAVLDTDFELHVHRTRRTDGRTEVGTSKKECFFGKREY